MWPRAGALDLMLPLAFSQVKHVVAALVSESEWLSLRTPHRDVWLHDEAWWPRLGLIVRIVGGNGRLHDKAWFLMFTSKSVRERLIGARIPSSCSECVWDARRPLQLTLVNSWQSRLKIGSVPHSSRNKQLTY
jgi:hypothetical protein